MTISCYIWMICLKLNWFFYGLSRMLQFSEFVWTLSYSVWDVFNKFLLIDATDWIKTSSDQQRFFIALSLYPHSFSANTPLKNTGCPNKHWNSMMNSMSSFQIIWFCIVIPSEKAVICKSFVCYVVCLCFDWIRLYLVKQEYCSLQTE